MTGQPINLAVLKADGLDTDWWPEDRETLDALVEAVEAARAFFTLLDRGGSISARARAERAFSAFDFGAAGDAA